MFRLTESYKQDNHPFNGLSIDQLPVIKSIDLQQFYTVASAYVHRKGISDDGKEWEYGTINGCFAYYSMDGTIVILDKPPGDFIGHDLFGDVLILVGYDGAFFYNVKTLERGGVTN